MTQSPSHPLDPRSFEAPVSNGNSLAWLRRVVREPFFQFTLLGALVFLGHRAVTPSPEPPTIEISRDAQRTLGKLFEQRTGRAPNQAEREALVHRAIEDEALYREGLRLSLAQTDPVLREQLIARVSVLLQPEPEQKAPSDEELLSYYQQHLSQYTLPETMSYREYWIHRGPEAGADARQLMRALRAGEAPGEELPVQSEHSGRTQAQLAALYDQEVGAQIWAIADDEWHEFRSERGIHIVQRGARTKGKQIPFADVRKQVEGSYLKDRAQQAFRAELDALIAQFRVQVAEAE